MNWQHLTDFLSRCKPKKITKRKDLEKKLCKKIKIINEYEEEILQIWRNVEELKSKRERQTRSMISAKERYEKASRDRHLLTEEVQKIELGLQRALKRRKKTLLEKMGVKSRVRELKKQKDAMERKYDMLWEMTFSMNQREERRESRGNLRRTRSQNDTVHVVQHPL
ncbi:uncharacterized protein LOC144641654 [Oculina patagonica]